MTEWVGTMCSVVFAGWLIGWKCMYVLWDGGLAISLLLLLLLLDGFLEQG